MVAWWGAAGDADRGDDGVEVAGANEVLEEGDEEETGADDTNDESPAES